jgi:CDP-diacylglycerol--serine O-phosphatidyltransferase
MRTGLMRIKNWYRMIPTALTLGNTLCGFTAILYTLQVYGAERAEMFHHMPRLLAISAWLIVGAMIFDMLDGWTARLLNASSLHGMHMDSLADMVTFGVAPAVMVSVMADTRELVWLPSRWVWGLCAIYLACAALRLALYNVKAMQQDEPCDEFHGLPSPGAAAAVSSLVFLYSNPQYEYQMLAQMLPVYAGILGFLMVSPIPYMHIGQWLGSKRRNKLKMFLLIVFFLLFSVNPSLVAAVAINVYVLSGPVRALLIWALPSHEEEEARVAVASNHE